MSLFKNSNRAAIEELYRRTKALEYQGNPEAWLKERLREDNKLLNWSAYSGYSGHSWDGTPDPFKTAFDALAAKEWVGIESATSVGKTYFLPRVIYWFLDTFPNSLVVTTAPKKEQLRRVLWTEVANAFPKFKRIRPHAELYTLNLTVDARTRELNMHQNEKGVYVPEGNSVGHEAIGIVSGVGAGEESATKMQGFHRENMLFIIEECAGVHAAVITAIINTSTAENNLILAVGNPDSEIDALHTFCNLSKVRHVIISGYDHPNVVLGKTVIPGAVTSSSIDFRKEEYGEESPFYKSRVRGIAPTESNDSLIRGEYFDQCDELNPERFMGVEFENNLSYNAVGVDVANSEQGDMAALAWGKGNRLDFVQEFQCPNATHLAYNLLKDDLLLGEKNYKNYGTRKIASYDILPQCIGVDGVGVGAATVNAFYDEGYPCVSLVGGVLDFAMRTGENGEDLFKFANLRAQMWFEFREDLRSGQVIISIENKKLLRALKKELVTVRYRVQSGKIYVESKDEVKKRLGGKSPNLADAVVYWNWVRKGYYMRAGHLPFA